MATVLPLCQSPIGNSAIQSATLNPPFGNSNGRRPEKEKGRRRSPATPPAIVPWFPDSVVTLALATKATPLSVVLPDSRAQRSRAGRPHDATAVRVDRVGIHGTLDH